MKTQHRQCKSGFKNLVQRDVMITFLNEKMHSRTYNLGLILSMSLVVWMMEQRIYLLNLHMTPIWEEQHEQQRTEVFLTKFLKSPTLQLKSYSPISKILFVGRKRHKPKRRVFSRYISTERSLGITTDLYGTCVTFFWIKKSRYHSGMCDKECFTHS